MLYFKSIKLFSVTLVLLLHTLPHISYQNELIVVISAMLISFVCLVLHICPSQGDRRCVSVLSFTSFPPVKKCHIILMFIVKLQCA